MQNYIFWSEIWSGFEEPGDTSPPRIPRSTPPGYRSTNTFSRKKIQIQYNCDLKKKTVHGDTFDGLLEFLISEVIKEFVIEVRMHYGNLRAQLKDILRALVS